MRAINAERREKIKSIRATESGRWSEFYVFSVFQRIADEMEMTKEYSMTKSEKSFAHPKILEQFFTRVFLFIPISGFFRISDLDIRHFPQTRSRFSQRSAKNAPTSGFDSACNKTCRAGAVRLPHFERPDSAPSSRNPVASLRERVSRISGRAIHRLFLS